jgi:hypothetical protein
MHKITNERDDLKGDYYNQDGELTTIPVHDWSIDEEKKAKRKYVLFDQAKYSPYLTGYQARPDHYAPPHSRVLLPPARPRQYRQRAHR